MAGEGGIEMTQVAHRRNGDFEAASWIRRVWRYIIDRPLA
jgi:hypothetical protein